MGKIIQDLWILTSSGITVYSHVYNSKINDQLFGALMSAINQFAETIVEGGISNFELRSKKFTIIKHRDLLFIANTANKEKEKKIKQELERISRKFYEIYGEKLSNWDYDVSIFTDFEKHIETSLKDAVKKFQDAIW